MKPFANRLLPLQPKGPGQRTATDGCWPCWSQRPACRTATAATASWLQERFSTITLVWADGGYAGRLVAWAAAALALTVTIVKRSDNLRGFVVLPRRGSWNVVSVG